MESFRAFLQQEYLRRNAKNKNYSLRSFAQHIGEHHATLSSLLSGKRPFTKKSVVRIARALGLSPAEIANLTSAAPAKRAPVSKGRVEFQLLEQDAFAAMSEWYFDAILELGRVRGMRLEPAAIAGALGISELKAKLALETLARLGLLKVTAKGEYQNAGADTTNLLDVESTSVAMRRYQKAILEKSLEALENVPRNRRDHTSTTLAVKSRDLRDVKKLIQDFRRDLCSYVQRAGVAADEVYQLQVSFFPLSRIKE